jgi:hypothetical protein
LGYKLASDFQLANYLPTNFFFGMPNTEESKNGSTRSRSRDRDCGDSLVIKVSNLKDGTSKDDVKEFLVDIEIEVRISFSKLSFLCRKLAWPTTWLSSSAPT